MTITWTENPGHGALERDAVTMNGAGQPEGDSGVDLEALVRRNAGTAGLAGALLIFFGFFFLDPPVGSTLFDRASSVFVYTLRIGGLALIGVAAWSAFGHLPALLGDAVVSMAIGVTFAVTGLVMLVDGELAALLQVAINVVCGTLFFTSGLRNGQEYRRLTKRELGCDDEILNDLDVLDGESNSLLAHEIEEQKSSKRDAGRRAARRGETPELIDIRPVKKRRQRKSDSSADQPIHLDGLSPEDAAGRKGEGRASSSEGYPADSAKRKGRRPAQP